MSSFEPLVVEVFTIYPVGDDYFACYEMKIHGISR